MRLEPTELTEDEQALREEVRAFLTARLPAASYLPGLGMAGDVDPQFSRDLGARGWLGMTLPKEYGGGGRSAVDRLIVVEELLAAGEFGDETSLNLRLGAAMAGSGSVIAAATSVASTVGV